MNTPDWYRIVLADEAISTRLSQLGTLELKLSTHLSTNALEHPNTVIGVKLPTGRIRDLYLLWSIRTLLPVYIRMEVEVQWETRYPKLQVGSLVGLTNYRDRFVVQPDLRFLNGRAKERLLWLINQIRVNLIQPRKPKSSNRIRGYRDKGTLVEASVTARRESNRAGAALEETDSLPARFTAWQLACATDLLEREATGEDPERIQENWSNPVTQDLPYQREVQPYLQSCSFSDSYCVAGNNPSECPALQGGNPEQCEVYQMIVSMLA